MTSERQRKGGGGGNDLYNLRGGLRERRGMLSVRCGWLQREGCYDGDTGIILILFQRRDT